MENLGKKQKKIDLLNKEIDKAAEKILKSDKNNIRGLEKNLLELGLKKILLQINLSESKRRIISESLIRMKLGLSEKEKNICRAQLLLNMHAKEGEKQAQLIAQYISLGREYFKLGEVLNRKIIEDFLSNMSITTDKTKELSFQLSQLIREYDLERKKILSTMDNDLESDRDNNFENYYAKVEILKETIISLLNLLKISNKILDIDLLEVEHEILIDKLNAIKKEHDADSAEERDEDSCILKRILAKLYSSDVDLAAEERDEELELVMQIMQIECDYFARTGRFIYPNTAEIPGKQKKLELNGNN